MSKHTPGPWTLDAGNDRNYPSVLISHDWITVNVGDTDETCLANAALIAAAPELLEAAHIVEHYINKYISDNPAEYGDWASGWNKLSAAIAKAEGNA